MRAERRAKPWVKVLSVACGAALVSAGVGCGGGPAAGSALSAAVDERRQEVENGEASGGAADLLFALLAAGLEASGDEASGATGASALTEDPHDHSAAGDVVDEPLAPKAAETDKRDLSCGTSPDPAPEMPAGDPSSAECADGYAEFQGECLPEQVVEELIALGLDPGDPTGT